MSPSVRSPSGTEHIGKGGSLKSSRVRAWLGTGVTPNDLQRKVVPSSPSCRAVVGQHTHIPGSPHCDERPYPGTCDRCETRPRRRSNGRQPPTTCGSISGVRHREVPWVDTNPRGLLRWLRPPALLLVRGTAAWSSAEPRRTRSEHAGRHNRSKSSHAVTWSPPTTLGPDGTAWPAGRSHPCRTGRRARPRARRDAGRRSSPRSRW